MMRKKSRFCSKSHKGGGGCRNSIYFDVIRRLLIPGRFFIIKFNTGFLYGDAHLFVSSFRWKKPISNFLACFNAWNKMRARMSKLRDDCQFIFRILHYTQKFATLQKFNIAIVMCYLHLRVTRARPKGIFFIRTI